MSKPKLILYDEPTAGLDPVASPCIYDLVREEQQRLGTTCVVISSDVAGLFTICDRVAMLHQGRIVFEGTRDDARERDPGRETVRPL